MNICRDIAMLKRQATTLMTLLAAADLKIVQAPTHPHICAMRSVAEGPVGQDVVVHRVCQVILQVLRTDSCRHQHICRDILAIATAKSGAT